jgi:hypothetical protein
VWSEKVERSAAHSPARARSSANASVFSMSGSTSPSLADADGRHLQLVALGERPPRSGAGVHERAHRACMAGTPTSEAAVGRNRRSGRGPRSSVGAARIPGRVPVRVGVGRGSWAREGSSRLVGTSLVARAHALDPVREVSAPGWPSNPEAHRGRIDGAMPSARRRFHQAHHRGVVVQRARRCSRMRDAERSRAAARRPGQTETAARLNERHQSLAGAARQRPLLRRLARRRVIS